MLISLPVRKLPKRNVRKNTSIDMKPTHSIDANAVKKRWIGTKNSLGDK